MFIDFLGGVFSDLSLAFKPKFDVFGAVAYSLVIVSLSADAYTDTAHIFVDFGRGCAYTSTYTQPQG